MQTYDINDPGLGERILDDVDREAALKKSADGVIGQYRRGFLSVRELRDGLDFILETDARVIERAMTVVAKERDTAATYTWVARTRGNETDHEWRNKVRRLAEVTYGRGTVLLMGEITRVEIDS